MRISDWSSECALPIYEVDREVRPVHLAQVGDGDLDVASEDVDGELVAGAEVKRAAHLVVQRDQRRSIVVGRPPSPGGDLVDGTGLAHPGEPAVAAEHPLHIAGNLQLAGGDTIHRDDAAARSEEHTSELQSLMRISYAVFCLQKQN